MAMSTTAEIIVTSKYAPTFITDDISIPQFFTRYNPDNVPDDKIVHVDLIKGKEITYGGLRAAAARGAWGLKNRMGLKEGDVVCILAQNSSDFVILAHSIWWAGAVVSPINPLLTAKDILHCMTLVHPTHVAVSKVYYDKVQDALRQFTGRIRPAVFSLLDKIEGVKKFPEEISGTAQGEILSAYDLSNKSSKDVVASIIYSSGTTGKMKGVKLSHYNHIVNLLQGRTSVPMRQNSEQRVVFFAPFTCALPTFDLETYCAQFSKYRATLAYLVPPVVLLLVASDIPRRYDFSALECMIIAAAPLKPALQKRVKAIFPKTKITQGYGLSECSPSVLMQHESDEGAANVGTCGKLLSSTAARLVSPITGKDVGVNEEGELWVRGPQTMMGYVGDAKSTADSFAGAWLRTGDIMLRDANDNFWVTDRLKEMIKYKGLQIAPSELEDLLVQHEKVVDAAVCAVYDDAEATEVPLAYISVTQGVLGLGREEVARTCEEVRRWIDGRVAGYKKLRGGVHHMQVLPKNPSGKILRKDLPAKKKGGRIGVL